MSASAHGARVPTWLGATAVSGIAGATVIMLAASSTGPSVTVPPLGAHGWAPPWWVPWGDMPWHAPARFVIPALWLAVLLGAVGVVAGLVAVARGARPRVRVLLGFALLATALFTVLPPAGSTDTLDYAAYGSIAAAGHNPYALTPQYLRHQGGPIGRYVPREWRDERSVYGPLATLEEAAAVRLGGGRMADITFWLKLVTGLAFLAVALALDAVLRHDPVRRLRAHLLWSVNPLMLWDLVAGGHVDALAVAVGFIGLLCLTRDRLARHPVAAGFVSGALVGAAVNIKVTFAVFGLAVAWAARKSAGTLAGAAAGALATVVPPYLWFGSSAVAVLLQRGAGGTLDNFYKFLARLAGAPHMPAMMLAAYLLLVVVAALLLWRLPDDCPSVPAARVALALSVAWLLVWPYQRPWYDVLAFCPLALYGASRLDWAMLARLTVPTLSTIPGMPHGMPWHVVLVAQVSFLVPLVRLGALVYVVALCVTGAWTPRTARLAASQAGVGQADGQAGGEPPGQPLRPDLQRPTPAE